MGKRITLDSGTARVVGKTPNGEGTVTKRNTKAGVRWQMAIYDGDGKRRYSYFKSEREARAALKTAQQAKDAGQPVKPERHTMAELFDAWLTSLWAQVDRGERSYGTWRQYDSHVRRHLKPAFGGIDCRRLTVQQVEDFLTGVPLSPKTRASLRIALRRALNVARRWGWVDRNIVSDTEPITVPQQHPPALSIAAAKRLADALRGDPLWSVYVTALFTGLRAGELAGLAIEHLNLDAGTARICQQVQRIPGSGLVITEPKSRASATTIELLPDVVAVLRGVIGERRSGLVWVTKSGKPYDPVYFTHRFQAALRAAGLPVIHLHHLRHYFVSFLPQLDVHPAVAQKLARHASVSTTMSIYTSVEDGLKRQAMSKLDAALRGLTPTVDVSVDVPPAGLRALSQAQA
ncbi:MAG TPA: tyrosine-type recombinase/integrase [Dehalococcoidia bacterium]|nr:tyrosine-type recombinase/integrase [Dehalococcoidia bacterium]